MTQRTSTETVTFARSFVLGTDSEQFPAGAYLVETDEEFIDGVSFLASRRTACRFHVPASPAAPGLKRTLSINPRDLDEALKRDQEPAAGLTATLRPA